jgi:hypothetical protein
VSPASRVLGLMVLVAFGLKALAALVTPVVLVVLVGLFVATLIVGTFNT